VLGETEIRRGVGARTVNSPNPVTGVPPVVTVTSRSPRAAAPAIVMLAVKLVALATETELTVTPGPNDTLEAFEKLVPEPIIVTASVCPDWPLEGVTLVICSGGLSVT
jgi:hypothetical protein